MAAIRGWKSCAGEKFTGCVEDREVPTTLSTPLVHDH
jgi:hypothetical protein